MAVYFNEGFAPVSRYDNVAGILQKLASEITASANANWSIHFPELPANITNLLVLKHTLGSGGNTRDVYVEFHQPVNVQQLDEGGNNVSDIIGRPNNYYMEVVYGTGIYTAPIDDEDGFYDKGTWEEDKASVRARFSWFRADTESTIKKWLPIQYFISITDERIAFVLAGDASANKLDRIIGFAYLGQIKPFNNSKGNILNNFAVTVSSDVPPGEYLTNEEKTRYSDKTGTGVTDICMLGTYTGFPMQSHMPAFTTPDEFVDKQLEGPSSYTDKYHMSPVYVFHGFDGYRGELHGVVATDRSTVINKDDLIHKYNSITNTEENPDTQDIYKVFLVNAPYSILNNGTNVMYGLAILKSTEPYVEP